MRLLDMLHRVPGALFAAHHFLLIGRHRCAMPGVDVARQLHWLCVSSPQGLVGAPLACQIRCHHMLVCGAHKPACSVDGRPCTAMQLLGFRSTALTLGRVGGEALLVRGELGLATSCGTRPHTT